MTARTIICTAVLLGIPAVGGADNSLSIRVSNNWNADPSFDVVSDDDFFAQVELNYARRLLSLWRGELWVEAAYMVGPSRTSLFAGAVETRLLLQNVTVSARYSYPVYAWLVPHARFGLGVGVGTLDLETTEGETVKDRAAGLAGHFLIGVEVLWPRPSLLHGSSDLTAGVVIEAGYGFGTDLELDVAPDKDDEVKRISLDGSRLGGLAVGGWQLRVGGVLRF